MPITDGLRQQLASALGLNWETLQANLREAAFPQPPYKEPLMYLLYLIPEIPWRQCERLSTRLRQMDLALLSEEALQLTMALDRAAITHRPYTL